jgi:hypothetical protein
VAGGAEVAAASECGVRRGRDRRSGAVAAKPGGHGSGRGGVRVLDGADATRYTVTSAGSDGVVAGVPSEYPPLYPWLIGKAAVLPDSCREGAGLVEALAATRATSVEHQLT